MPTTNGKTKYLTQKATMSESVEAKMAAAQLRLAGHVSEYCMP